MDRCRRGSSTLEQALTAVGWGHRMKHGGFKDGPGNGLGRHEYSGLGFGMWVAIDFDLAMCCFKWCIGVGGDKLMWMGHKCSLVHLYLLSLVCIPHL